MNELKCPQNQQLLSHQVLKEKKIKLIKQMFCLILFNFTVGLLGVSQIYFIVCVFHSPLSLKWILMFIVK